MHNSKKIPGFLIDFSRCNLSCVTIDKFIVYIVKVEWVLRHICMFQHILMDFCSFIRFCLFSTILGIWLCLLTHHSLKASVFCFFFFTLVTTQSVNAQFRKMNPMTPSWLLPTQAICSRVWSLKLGWMIWKPLWQPSHHLTGISTSSAVSPSGWSYDWNSSIQAGTAYNCLCQQLNTMNGLAHSDNMYPK